MGLSLGSYLSQPVTEKESTDEYNDKLICGASSMQGWRLSQEDAHNCILNYDTDTSFFAVYDGHGGHEVAQYCSEKLPEHIKDSTLYKENKIEEALKVGFLNFDSLITTPDVIEVLKKMANKDREEALESEDEENVNNLYEEAAMPIEQVIEKYTSNLINASLSKAEQDTDSSLSKTKKDSDPTVGTSASSCSSSSSRIEDKCGDGVSSSSEAEINDKNDGEKKTETNGSENVPEVTPEAESASKVKPVEPNSSDVKEVVSTLTGSEHETSVQNGEISTPDFEVQAKSDVSSSSTPVENGTPSKKGKGKAVLKPEPVKTPVNTRPKRSAQQIYKEWLDCGEDSEESDDEDKTFEGSVEESSDEDEADGVNVAITDEGSEEESSEEEDEDKENDDEDDDEEDMEFARNMNEEPGSDSGCTAVVALLRGNELYVANAGDSRCIVSRNGTAIEMSVDHKPEDQPETDRILKAGGRVSSDGRVNGGLNLSRAIGDHAYKQNAQLSDREQMITALPDIKTLTISPSEDEFMVLACDGIWNSMSSQEVVDFVRPRMTEGTGKLSKICEEMFDHCLSSSTAFDGAGCDNMTAIIVKFKSNTIKRSATPPHTEAKRTKTESESEAQIDTTV